MEFKKDFLRDRRIFCGWSQEEFAKKVGVSKQAVQKWESGAVTPREKRLRVISEVLDARIAEISRGSNLEKILPDDDFFKILLKNWPTLTIEQRSKLAGESSAMSEANSGVPSNSTTSATAQKRA
jgi:transcriptional regulator with XRE-family HTH domain